MIQSSEKHRNDSSNKVNAELIYSDYSLCLKIENNSDDSLYLYTDIINKIEIFYNGKRVAENFLFSFGNLPPLPDPPNYDTLDQTDKGIGPYLNCSNSQKADSILLVYLLREYKRINKQETINPEEISILSSKFEVAMFLTGGILFLPPHNYYIYEFKYTCFKLNPGSYKIKCRETNKNKHEYYLAEGFTKNSIIKLPYMPPRSFMGFIRYDGKIKCKSLKFVTVTYTQ